jgi:hypothetical protein
LRGQEVHRRTGGYGKGSPHGLPLRLLLAESPFRNMAKPAPGGPLLFVRKIYLI